MVESRTAPLVILIVDRDPTEAAAIAKHFVPASGPPSQTRIVCSPTIDETRSPLLDIAPDAVLLVVADREELASLPHIRRAYASSPVIVFAPESADLEEHALRGGAQDVVTPPLPALPVLRRIINRARERHRCSWSHDRAMRTMSHELRNALSTIQICAAELLEPAPPTESVHRAGGLIQRSTLWMQQILQDLTDQAPA